MRAMPGRTRCGVGAASRGSIVVRGAHEIEQVGSLGVVELEGAADGVENIVRDPASVTAFEPRVVLDADPRHERHLLAPQAAHPAVTAECWQTRALGRDLGSAGGQELANLVGGAHVRNTVRPS